METGGFKQSGGRSRGRSAAVCEGGVHLKRVSVEHLLLGGVDNLALLPG